MQLHITHETRYDYAPPVSMAQHIAYLQPRTTCRQQLLGHSLQTTPEPAHQQEMVDVFGNTRHYIALQTAHAQLQVVARSLVNTFGPLPACSHMAWEQVGQHLRWRAGQPFDCAGEWVFASPHVPHHADFSAYALPSLGSGVPLLWAARDLMQRIHRDFVYESQSTEVNTPALQALAQRKGVCQDFAHIMVACLRAHGLAARYVSGYLLTQPLPGQPRLVGSDASHAWVSVYLPDLPNGPQQTRWWDFDPTNNRDGCGTPGEDYVTLAIGRDYADVSPIRGVIHGGTHHTLQVGVTVEPFDTSQFQPAPSPPSNTP
jgi:transglutaminase-like putative cysteine protease